MLEIYVDGDGCPVKEEVYRVARRYGVAVHVVANSPMRVPAEPAIRLVVVGSGFDEADDWIAGRIGPGDVAITNDVRLAARCLARGARVIGSKGQVHTDESIGGTVAGRDLMEGLRAMGVVTPGPASFSPKHRSQFLSSLDEAVQGIKRKGR